jgi:hypothetical protein
MSALAMILTTAMAVPGDGPKKVSMEMEQRLDLSGEWFGTKDDGCVASDILLLPGRGTVCLGGCLVADPFVCFDRGHGVADVKWGSENFLGIYRQQGDIVIICFSATSRGRPTAFRSGDDRILFALHRIKSHK